MTRKKKGFLTFIFSLMPGAGEMYMGFMKRGVSVMCAFLGWIGICGVLQFGAGFYLAPVIWFYSFFSVHNLASLPDEEFYQIEDDYVLLHMDQIFRTDEWERGKVKFIAAACILLGGYTILTTIWHALWSMLPDWLYDNLYFIRNGIPRIMISLLLMAFGVYLIRGKKVQLEKETEAVYVMPRYATPEEAEAKPEEHAPVIIFGETATEEEVEKEVEKKTDEEKTDDTEECAQ